MQNVGWYYDVIITIKHDMKSENLEMTQTEHCSITHDSSWHVFTRWQTKNKQRKEHKRKGGNRP